MQITEEQSSRAQGPAHSRCLGDAVKAAWVMGGLCSGPAVRASGREGGARLLPTLGKPRPHGSRVGEGLWCLTAPLSRLGVAVDGDPGTRGQQPSAWDPAQPELADASEDTLASWCEHEAHAWQRRSYSRDQLFIDCFF